MPKFGWCKFAEEKFGTRVRYHDTKFRMISSTILGHEVRRTIRKRAGDISGAVTFRIREGNGHQGSVLGKVYQDKYKYTAAMAAIDTGLVPNKTMLSAAVDYWKNILTDEQRAEYNKRAGRQLRMSGYNLFISEALKGIFHMWVDRGDHSSLDFEIGDFTKDDAWHTLDLSGIIPITARLILFDFDYNNVAANRHIELRKQGQTYNFNHSEVHTRVAAQADHAIMIVACAANRLIEYKIATAGWSALAMTVRGWWT